MNILIQIRETATDSEIKEFTEGIGNNVYISHSTEDSITQLNNHPFEKAVVSLKSMQDAAILKYLNDYYPDIKVVVIANKAYDDILSIFQKGNYSVLHEPLKLSELKTQLVKKLKPA
jgi:DNA-binding NtrC family response regulator